MKLIKSTLFTLLCAVAMPSQALESDFEQPIYVTSIEQHAKMKSNTIIFSGDVVLKQGSIEINADKLTVVRGKQANQEVMIAEGNLATFHQLQEDGKPLDAQAKSVKYEVAKGKITLSKRAQIKQLDSQINGTQIVYFIDTQELNVTTDKTNEGRVKTVFLPAQFQKEHSAAQSSQDKQEEQK